MSGSEFLGMEGPGQCPRREKPAWAQPRSRGLIALRSQLLEGAASPHAATADEAYFDRLRTRTGFLNARR